MTDSDKPRPHTRMHAHTHTCTHTHTHTDTHTHSLTNTHTDARARTHKYTIERASTLCLFPPFFLPPLTDRSINLSLSLSFSHTQTQTHSHTDTHTVLQRVTHKVHWQQEILICNHRGKAGYHPASPQVLTWHTERTLISHWCFPFPQMAPQTQNDSRRHTKKKKKKTNKQTNKKTYNLTYSKTALKFCRKNGNKQHFPFLDFSPPQKLHLSTQILLINISAWWHIQKESSENIPHHLLSCWLKCSLHMWSVWKQYNEILYAQIWFRVSTFFFFAKQTKVQIKWQCYQCNHKH